MATDTIKVSKWYFSTPDAIFDVEGLDIYAQTIYIILSAHADREGKSFPAYDTLAKRGRMSRRKAIDSVTTLVEHGLLQKKPQQRDNGGDTSNEYTLADAYDVLLTAQSGGSAQDAPGGVHDMHPGSAQHAPKHNHLSLPSLNNDCLVVASAEVAAAAEESVPDDIYIALQETIPKTCFTNGMSLGLSAIAEIYLMLINQFPNQLSSEVARIACDLYYDRSQKITVTNPTGFFHDAYADAIKLWKVKRRKNE